MRSSEKENLLLNAALDIAAEKLAKLVGPEPWTAHVWRLVLLDDAEKALKAEKAASLLPEDERPRELAIFPGQVEIGGEFPVGQAFGTEPSDVRGVYDGLTEEERATAAAQASLEVPAESYPGACPICQGTGMMLDEADPEHHILPGTRCTSCHGTGKTDIDPNEV